MKSKKLIIAATSATGYAKAAVDCGFEVVTFDLFTDADTRDIAKQTFKLKLTEDSVDFDDFKHQFLTLKLEEYAGFLYGSLFDDAPDLLDWLADRTTLLGNTSQVIRIVKGFEFFSLLSSLGVRYPVSRLLNAIESVSQPEKWLVKQLGGCGGLHVKPALTKENKGNYLQQKIEGLPISLLFIADGKNIQTVGVNQQFISPTTSLPYRFAGAVSHIVIAEEVKTYLEQVAKQLTKALSLHGCNSLDAIFDGEYVWILELNPRLSATFCLYPNLMDAHLKSCAGELVELPKNASSLAQLVLYADKRIKIPASFNWPSNVMNVPKANNNEHDVCFDLGAPICTVMATSKTAIDAQQLVYESADLLKKRLLELSD